MVRAAFNALASLLLLISGESFANAQERTTVMLVRHAQRESLATPDPPLTAAGRERALALRSALRCAGIEAIITTQFSRTQATAAPLSVALGITKDRPGHELPLRRPYAKYAALGGDRRFLERRLGGDSHVRTARKVRFLDSRRGISAQKEDSAGNVRIDTVLKR